MPYRRGPFTFFIDLCILNGRGRPSGGRLRGPPARTQAFIDFAAINGRCPAGHLGAMPPGKRLTPIAPKRIKRARDAPVRCRHVSGFHRGSIPDASCGVPVENPYSEATALDSRHHKYSLQKLRVNPPEVVVSGRRVARRSPKAGIAHAGSDGLPQPRGENWGGKFATASPPGTVTAVRRSPLRRRLTCL